MKPGFSKYLSLEPYEFDQGDNGWRELDEKGKFLEAAQIIEQYIEENKEKLEEYYKENSELGSVMVFHAGQLYATAGPQYYKKAIPFLKDSFRGEDEGWNLYVKGTIAFLTQNAETLNKCLDSLREDDPKHIRVTVLDRLKRGLEQGITYQRAYDSK
jgi:hypothetical protein